MESIESVETYVVIEGVLKKSPDVGSSESFEFSSSELDYDSEADHVSPLVEYIRKTKRINKYSPLIVNVPAGLDFSKFKEKSCMKMVEAAKEVPISPLFEKVSSVTDPQINERHVLITPNKASKIFYAIASHMFHSTDRIMASQVKLLYLRQVEKDYMVAKKSADRKEKSRLVNLVNRVVSELDEPWLEEEWLLASKALFAPIHVLFSCPRVPAHPHVTCYRFSPVVDHENPIRVVIDNGDYQPY